MTSYEKMDVVTGKTRRKGLYLAVAMGHAREWKKQGSTVAEIARVLNVSENTIRRWLK